MRSAWLAIAWGFAEATLFFVVPDVLLSWYAIDGYRRALIACFYALAGALAGGTLMWSWGYFDPASARATVDLVPAISTDMIARVQLQVAESGALALFVGPITGTPYKIYAVESATVGYGLALFLLVSIPARLMRFVAVTLLVGGLARLLAHRLPRRNLRIALVVSWCVFYAWYFWQMRDA